MLTTIPDTRTAEQILEDEQRKIDLRKAQLKAQREHEKEAEVARKLWDEAKAQCWGKP